jgi:lysophospholipase L1-like esterase
MGTARRRHLGRAKLLLFSFLPTIFLLVVAETTLRMYVAYAGYAQQGEALPYPTQRQAYQRSDPVMGYALKPGYEAGGIHINRLGFRGPELSTAKQPGLFRIAAVGDSTTFGLAGEHCPYRAQLQGLLNAHEGGVKFEVVNAGVEGYSSWHALRLVETRIAGLQPDLVVIYIGWNDLYSTNPFQANSPRSQREALSRSRGTFASWVLIGLDKLYLVQFLRGIIYKALPRVIAYVQPVDTSPGKQPHPAATAAYKENLVELIATIKRTGAVPVLLTLPTVVSKQMSGKALSMVHYPTWARGNYKTFLAVIEAYNNVIRDTARERAIPLIDNASFIESLGPQKDKLFFDSLHLYCGGYKLLAEHMARQLTAQDLIPGG